MKEGKVDKYLDKPAVQPRRNADANEEPPTKTIRIISIFVESEHLGATNNSKKRNIQQALLVWQVQAVNTQLGPIVSFTKQDAKGVDFLHDGFTSRICPTSLCHSRQNDGWQRKCGQPTSALSNSEDEIGKHNHTPSGCTHQI